MPNITALVCTIVVVANIAADKTLHTIICLIQQSKRDMQQQQSHTAARQKRTTHPNHANNRYWQQRRNGRKQAKKRNRYSYYSILQQCIYSITWFLKRKRRVTLVAGHLICALARYTWCPGLAKKTHTMVQRKPNKARKNQSNRDHGTLHTKWYMQEHYANELKRRHRHKLIKRAEMPTNQHYN